MYQLVLGNKNHSSWSMRGWMLLKLAGVSFKEVGLNYGPGLREKVLAYGGESGLVPVLVGDDISIWDSLAIAEYLYEAAPQIWPVEKAERARARSLSAEMHSGFMNLRTQMPYNMRADDRVVERSEALNAEIERISNIWSQARGPWLCGQFCAVDIMFAPVATRFHTYGIELEGSARSYAQLLLDHPLTRGWLDLANHEPVVEKYERPRRSAANTKSTMAIRPCDEPDIGAMVEIINQAAGAYHGAIPSDCWHEPYMPEAELRSEIAAGVRFIGCEIDGELAGVMGIQSVRNVELIRHAYVRRAYQGSGVGTALIDYLCATVSRQILVGTWTAATWAIGFYERSGFTLIVGENKDRLLRTYWSISDRQVETSIVLAKPPLDDGAAEKLMKAACQSSTA